MATYTLDIRLTETVATGPDGYRIGSFDRTAGASRGTLRGRIVASEYAAWIKALDAWGD